MFICDVGSPNRTGDLLCCCMAKVSPLEASQAWRPFCVEHKHEIRLWNGFQIKIRLPNQSIRVGDRVARANKRRRWFFLSVLDVRQGKHSHPSTLSQQAASLPLAAGEAANKTESKIPRRVFASRVPRSRFIFLLALWMRVCHIVGAFLRAQIIAISGNRSNICLHNRMHSTELIEIDSR